LGPVAVPGEDDRAMKWFKRVLTAVVLVGLGYGGYLFFGFNHSIPNGDLIFAEVSSIRAAVPKSAVNIQTASSPASWISGCSQIPGSRDGWTTDQVSVDFTDTRPKWTVVAALSGALAKKGWRRHDASPGLHQGKIPHWTLNVRTNNLVQAWAFPVGPGTEHWALTASWIPPGPRGQGCP
jgi:hypothetical protein